MTALTAPLRNTGIALVGHLPWGAHFCHFFDTKQDLLDTLLPFFKAGLEAGELCLWVVAEPLTAEEARTALERTVPDLDALLADGHIEIVAAREWYLGTGAIDLRTLIAAWDKRLAQALRDGFVGLRATGSTAWLQEKDWRDFSDYESKLNEWIADKRMIALCSYPLATGSATAILDVARTHDFAIAKRNGAWEVVETPEFREAKAEIKRLNNGLQQRVAERTAELEALRADAEAALDRLRAIHSITDAALSYLGLDDLLRELLARLRGTLRADVVSVRLIDEQRKDLYLRAIDGVPFERMAGVRFPIDAIHLDAPFLRNDLEPPAPGSDDWRAQAWAALRMPLRAGMSTPLVVEGKPIGIVGVTSTRAPFTEDDLHLLQVVADRVAPAIERGRLDETVRAGRELLKGLSRRLLTAEEEQRRRLAVELHDELGQVLTAVKINLASLERQSGAATTSSHLTDAIASVDHAMDRVRDIALDLRPSVLDDLGLPAAIRWYADRFARSTGVEAFLSIDAVPDLSPETETACFRVAQEALTNVARHAQARKVWVDLHVDAEALELRVRDDGIGFDPRAVRERAVGGASLGLLGMQERVSLVAGTYELVTRPGSGTEIRARFPLGEKGRTVP